MTNRINVANIEGQVESCREMIDLGMGIQDDLDYIEDASNLREQLGEEAWLNNVQLEEDKHGAYSFDDTTWKVV